MELVNGRQLDLFELMASIQSLPVKAKAIPFREDGTDVVLKEGEDTSYLEKGERIESLARERFIKVFEGMSVSELEQKIFSKPYNTCSNLFDHVTEVARIIRAFIADVTYRDEEDEKIKTLKGLIDFDFSIRMVDIEGESYVHAVRKLRYRNKKSTDLVCLTLREGGFNPLSVYCYRALNAGKKPLLFRDGSCCGDLATILSWLYVVTLYNRAIVDEGMAGPLAEAFRDWTNTGVEESYIDVWREIRRESGVEKLRDKDGNTLSVKDSLLSSLNKAKFRLPYKKYLHPRPEVLDEFRRIFDVTGADIPATGIKKNIVTQRNREEMRDSKGALVYQWIIPYDVEYGIVSTDPIAYFKKGFGSVSYNRLLSRADHIDRGDGETIPLCWPIPDVGSVNAPYELMKAVIRTVWAEKGLLVRKYRYYRDMDSGKSVAKSYQTKKGIPAKILKEMEESVFNKFFGYVEFDELCDLEKIRAIADEFISFKEEVLPGFDSKQVALRFRRLGNHKASGLYYPMLGCLCVDINSPSSFVHEYGHCMDNVAGNGRLALSDMEGFAHVYSLYADALISAVNKDSDVKQKLSGGSKYNLDYYLLKTEAFARCFELYVAEVLGVDTSLCKQASEMGWAYPKDEKLLEAVEGYFSGLLVTVNRIQDETPLCA